MVPNKVQLSVVIPALNEAARISQTLVQYSEYLNEHYPDQHEIIVVDDGSTDGTETVVKDLDPSYRVLRLNTNQGKGAAVRAGVLASRGEMILFADADGSTAISEERRLVEALNGGADIAIGSRAAGTGQRVWVDGSSRVTPFRSDDVTWTVKRHRHSLGRVFAGLTNLVFDLGIRDTQCGFKLFKAESARRLFEALRSRRFAFDVEILWLARRLDLKVKEVPVTWSERAGSKLRLSRDPFLMLWELAQIRFAPDPFKKPQLASLNSTTESAG